MVAAAAAAAVAPPAGAAERSVGPDLVAFGLSGGAPAWAVAPDRSDLDYSTPTAIRLLRGDPATVVGELAPVTDGGIGAVTIAGDADGTLAVARDGMTSTFRDISNLPFDMSALALPGAGLRPVGACDPGHWIEGYATAARWAPIDADGGLVAVCRPDADGVAILDGATGAEVDRVPGRWATAPRIAGSLVAYVERASRYDETGAIVVFDRATRSERYRIDAGWLAHLADYDLAADGSVVLTLGATSLLIGPRAAWTASPTAPEPRRLPIPASRFLTVKLDGDRVAYSRWDAAAHRQQVGVLALGEPAPHVLAEGPVVSTTAALDDHQVAYGYRTCGGGRLVTVAPDAPTAERPLPRCPLRLLARPRVSPTGRVLLKLDCTILVTQCFASVSGAAVRRGGVIDADGSSYALRLTVAARDRLRARGQLTLRLRLAYDGAPPARTLTVRLRESARSSLTLRNAPTAIISAPASPR